MLKWNILIQFNNKTKIKENIWWLIIYELIYKNTFTKGKYFQKHEVNLIKQWIYKKYKKMINSILRIN